MALVATPTHSLRPLAKTKLRGMDKARVACHKGSTSEQQDKGEKQFRVESAEQQSSDAPRCHRHETQRDLRANTQLSHPCQLRKSRVYSPKRGTTAEETIS